MNVSLRINFMAPKFAYPMFVICSISLLRTAFSLRGGYIQEAIKKQAAVLGSDDIVSVVMAQKSKASFPKDLALGVYPYHPIVVLPLVLRSIAVTTHSIPQKSVASCG